MILALVPRDLLNQLPVPKRIRTYLDTPFYYSETIADWTVPRNEPVSSNLSKNEDIGTEVEQTSPLPSITSPREEDQSSNPVLGDIVHNPIDTNQTYPINHNQDQIVDSSNADGEDIIAVSQSLSAVSPATPSSSFDNVTLSNLDGISQSENQIRDALPTNPNPSNSQVLP